MTRLPRSESYLRRLRPDGSIHTRVLCEMDLLDAMEAVAAKWPRRMQALRLRYGVGCEPCGTLRRGGEMMGVCPERFRQLTVWAKNDILRFLQNRKHCRHEVSATGNPPVPQPRQVAP